MICSHHIKPGEILNSVLKPKPTQKASAAANMPIQNVPNPDSHHVARDQRLLIAPIAKKATPVATTHWMSPPAQRYVTSGTRPHNVNATNVLSAATPGDFGVGARPYSSTTIVFAQRDSSAVITSTIASRLSPEKPLPPNICLISSRSPSGTVAMCLRSTASRRL